MTDFKPLEHEAEIFKFWQDNEIYKKIKERNNKGKKFYFLDGPPYTSGRVHVGTAWNKALKDMILRYKRMRGFNVIDRAGYDMHGLPTENATERKLGIKSKDEIPKMGVDKFVKACKDLSQENLKIMNEDFKRMGVWMDFDYAYQTVSNDYIDGEWWLVKRAHENKRLYQGLRAMAWDWSHETALAKHELEYQVKTDKSIFVKMQIKGKENEYLVIWTTTPWTIPFNLGIMAHPEYEYVKCKIDNEGHEEYWIVAKDLANIFISSVAQKEFEIVEEFKGKKLEKTEYIHPFYNELKEHYDKLKDGHPNVHTVVMSDEFVDTSAGSGLVHMAPGCGPEDYEVGYRNNIPAWNLVEENARYPQSMGSFAKRHAIKDNHTFIDDLEKNGSLIATTEIEHEYPHGQRSHEPVIFRTTKQWFFKVEDLKEKMIEENNKVQWVPQAGYNAFNSWLNNLRDNSISKQRYWGTPLPVWKNTEDEDDYIVIGSIKELEELSGQKVKEPHIPWIDDIIIKKDGKTYKRVTDVLDVWVDAGTASWNSLNFPRDEKSFNELFPADFILEGKDQIRGWFNLLHVASMVAFSKPCFKACYMHGYIQDAQGRKMSKSEGNYITPGEVIDTYGVDATRFYLIGGTNAGLDLNYNFEDLKAKYKNMIVLWNLHKYVVQQAELLDYNPSKDHVNNNDYGLEEKFILSRMHSTLKKVTELYDNYKLDEIPGLVEALFLELSRTYVQLTREKLTAGDKKDKKTVVYVIYEVIDSILSMLAPLTPFITEKIFLNFKEKFGLDDESIHEKLWPKVDEDAIDAELENTMDVSASIIQSALFAREKAQRGVRWPMKEMIVISNREIVSKAVDKLSNLIKTQLNVKEISLKDSLSGVEFSIRPNYSRIAPIAGKDTQQIAEKIKTIHPQELLKAIDENGKYDLTYEEQHYNITKDMLDVQRSVPEPYVQGDFRYGQVYLDTTQTPELEGEGFAREMMRRVQDARKSKGLRKTDRINISLVVSKDIESEIKKHKDSIMDKVGADKLEILSTDPDEKYPNQEEFSIKGKPFKIFF